MGNVQDFMRGYMKDVFMKEQEEKKKQLEKFFLQKKIEE